MTNGFQNCLRGVAGICLVVTFFVVSCGQQEQIHSYTVPKEVKTATAGTEKPGEPTDRMLAAILPVEDQAWFFKVVGPIAAVDAREKEINEFFTKITVGDDGRAKWQLPSGWTEEAGSGMRLATIRIPADGKPLEVSVTSLPWTGTSDSMLQNVNRWRGQMQLTPASAADLGKDTHELKAGNRTLTIVDLRGRFQSGGMTPPFAGAAAGALGPAASSDAGQLPAGHPPVDGADSKLPPGHPEVDANQQTPSTAAANDTAAAPVPQFEAPKSWQSIAASGFRRAAFNVADGDKKAEMTIFDFPASSPPMMKDPLFNINRWRREIELPAIEQKDLAAATESFEIGGESGMYAAMIPDSAKPEQSRANGATLAAMVTHGDEIWFFKLKGDRDLVRARQDEFKNFLKSVKFAGGGAPDGNK